MEAKRGSISRADIGEHEHHRAGRGTLAVDDDLLAACADASELLLECVDAATAAVLNDDGVGVEVDGGGEALGVSSSRNSAQHESESDEKLSQCR